MIDVPVPMSQKPVPVILVVTSKIRQTIKAKAFIHGHSTFNMSLRVPSVLSRHVEEVLEIATSFAVKEDRLTVLDRDITDALMVYRGELNKKEGSNG